MCVIVRLMNNLRVLSVPLLLLDICIFGYVIMMMWPSGSLYLLWLLVANPCFSPWLGRNHVSFMVGLRLGGVKAQVMLAPGCMSLRRFAVFVGALCVGLVVLSCMHVCIDAWTHANHKFRCLIDSQHVREAVSIDSLIQRGEAA